MRDGGPLSTLRHPEITGPLPGGAFRSIVSHSVPESCPTHVEEFPPPPPHVQSGNSYPTYPPMMFAKRPEDKTQLRNMLRHPHSKP